MTNEKNKNRTTRGGNPGDLTGGGSSHQSTGRRGQKMNLATIENY